jgi:Holliday junction resolvase RusA-like endonuclease
MSRIEFVVPGQPRGKGRPRFARRGAYVTTYTDDQTAAYENLVALAYKAAGGQYRADAPMAVEIVAHYKIPKSASKARRQAMIDGAIRPQVKPDLDNIAKGVLDGLNGVAYADDKQVVALAIDKRYAEIPRLEVTASSMDAL